MKNKTKNIICVGLLAFVATTLQCNFNAPTTLSFQAAKNSSSQQNGVAKGNKTFDALGGYKEIIEQVTYLVDYLKDPQSYMAVGLSEPKGILISGPNGVGKTLLAEAIAGEANAHLITVNAAEVCIATESKPEGRLGEIFQQAKQLAPCVICLEEIECIAKQREEAPAATPALHQLINLLTSAHPGVVVIATSPDVEGLHPSLVRAGRFDSHITLELPTPQERKQILKKLLQNITVAADVRLEELSRLTYRYSSADLVALVSDARSLAFREKSAALHARHLDKALMQAVEGTVKANLQSVEDRRLTAAHESGHAIVGHMLGHEVYKISVLPAKYSWGRTIYIPSLPHSLTQKELTNQICIGLAGRAAEILMHEPAMGCADDLRKVRAIAKDMIHKEAMGKTIQGHPEEVEQILQTQLYRAVSLLEENRAAWEEVRETLVTQGEMHREAFLDVIMRHFSLVDLAKYAAATVKAKARAITEMFVH